MKQFLFFIVLLLASPAMAQTQLVCNQGSAKVPCTAPIGQTYVPSGIPATKIAGGTVSDAVFGYLAGATSSIQAQINALAAGAVALSSATPAAVGVATAGVATTAARADHAHDLPAVGTAGTSTYATVTTDAKGRVTALASGVAPVALSGSTPQPVGSATPGSTGTASDAGHVHAHGNQLGGALHADAVPGGASGFFSGSDKTKLDGVSPGATTVAVPISEANGGFGASVSGVGNGLLARTAENTPAARTLAAPAAGLAITNPGGVAGNPTFALANDLAALEALAGTGLAVRTAADTWTQRSVAGGAGITVTNGDGTAGNPTVALTSPVSVANGGTGSATGDAGSLVNLPAGQLSGNVALARIATALAGGGGPIAGTVISATVRVDASSIGPGSGNQHNLPGGTTDILTADSAAVVTGKSIDAVQLTGTVLDARLPAAMAGKTLTTATLTAPVINGAVTGTITVPTPTPASAQPATAAYAEAQKTGGTVITFMQTSANSWGGSQYIGIAAAASGANVFVPTIPFIVPSDGIIKILRVASNFAAPGANTVDIYRNGVATTITAAMASSSAGADTTHSVAVVAGDQLVALNNGALWNHLGVSASLRYIPNLVP